MSIESKIPETEINIKELQTASAEMRQVAEFNPVREMTQEEWNGIGTYIDQKLWNFPLAADILVSVKIIDPAKMDALPTLGSKWRQKQDDFENFWEKGEHSLWAWCYSCLKQIAPEKTEQDKIRQRLPQLGWQLERYKQKSEDWANYFSLAVNIKMLDPENHSGKSVDKLDKKTSDALPGRLTRLKQAGSWDKVAEYVADIKLAFPESLDIVNLTREDIQDIKHSWNKYRKMEDWSKVADMAANLKIITAPSATITEQGINFDAPADFKTSNKLPEVKKF